jgi:filamentous hemagglutinin family protein
MLALGMAQGSALRAQIIPSIGERNLGTNVGGSGSAYAITGGTQRGKNLFHSFSRFDVPPGGSAFFDGTGSSGVGSIFGRIETGPSKLAGPLGLRNWVGTNPQLMLMNPFGFLVEKGFSAAGISQLSLMATDALLFKNPSDPAVLFPFDMFITQTGLFVTNPNWANAEMVGFLMDSGSGQEGGPITVTGGGQAQKLNLVGSTVTVEGDPLKVDQARFVAQGFNGASVFDESTAFPNNFQVGNISHLGVFTAYNSSSQVGGVAAAAGFVESTAQLANLAGMGSCSGSCPAGSLQIRAALEPLDGSSAALQLIGRQTVLGPWVAANGFTSGSVTSYSSVLGGGFYTSLISLVPAPVAPAAGSATATPPIAVLDRLPRPRQELVALGPPLQQGDPPGGPGLRPPAPPNQAPPAPASGPAGPPPGLRVDPGFAPAAEVNPLAATQPLMTQFSVERLAPAQALVSLEQAEQRSSEKVAVALGLQQLDASAVPSTADVQRSLREVMAVVRSGDAQRAGTSADPGMGLLASAQTGSLIAAFGPSFNRATYTPAVLHLRYVGPGEQTASNAAGTHLDLVLITASAEPKGLRVAIRPNEFRESLQKLYGALARQEPLAVEDPQSPARSLYRQIFGPLQPLLQEQKITTLLLSADQGLQAIPYPALHDGQQFLGERYGLALTPSLNLTNLRLPLGRGGELLALGASQFDGLAPLPLVPEELRSIAAGQRSNVYLNQAFTPASLLITAADNRYRRVHVATHAEFLPGGPAQSHIYTGTGPVALREFSGLRSRRQDASLDLLSLSACRTALGDGESELGFAGLALQAGARSAMGSLWYVDDVATSAFFVQTYRLLDAGVPKAEALQLTRQAFSRGHIRLEGDRVLGAGGEVLLSGLDASQRRTAATGLSHPFFWGGIQLLGSPW